MKISVPQNLISLANRLDSPLYVVGGYVRNYLIGGILSDDIDLAATVPADALIDAAKSCGFKLVAEYKRTGTAVIFDGAKKYEYTRFRTDNYGVGGGHKPLFARFTFDIEVDARRRDFTCNAVYYDIKNDKIVDPLGGTEDIDRKILDTVKLPEEVFCCDGLRLMRLARFAGELGFTPTAAVIDGARTFADNINDIAPERIYDELKKILLADAKYPFSDKAGHYSALKILYETGVLQKIFPRIGKDSVTDLKRVSEKSAVLRLATLLKKVGTEKAEEYLTKLKADKRTLSETLFLIGNAGFDCDGKESEMSVRRFIVKNGIKRTETLLKFRSFFLATGQKGEDFSIKKWKGILKQMLSDGTPFTVKDLKISAAELIETGFKGQTVGEELKRLFEFTIARPSENKRGILKEKAKSDFKEFLSGLDK